VYSIIDVYLQGQRVNSENTDIAWYRQFAILSSGFRMLAIR